MKFLSTNKLYFMVIKKRIKYHCIENNKTQHKVITSERKQRLLMSKAREVHINKQTFNNSPIKLQKETFDSENVCFKSEYRL